MKKFMSAKLARVQSIKIPFWWPVAVLICAALICLYGWVANIGALIDSPTFGGLEAARAFGIPAFPLGIILGLFA